jgi:hypothetical protein
VGSQEPDQPLGAAQVLLAALPLVSVPAVVLVQPPAQQVDLQCPSGKRV